MVITNEYNNLLVSLYHPSKLNSFLIHLTHFLYLVGGLIVRLVRDFGKASSTTVVLIAG